VLYRLRRDAGTPGRLVSAILDALVRDDAGLRAERERAALRSRSHTDARVQEPLMSKTTPRARRPT
jgi:hypothetical protein